jgi:hypothetical protein
VLYNFVRMHKAHKLSPAMAARLSDRPWSMDDIVALIDARVPKPGPAAPTKSSTQRRVAGEERIELIGPTSFGYVNAVDAALWRASQAPLSRWICRTSVASSPWARVAGTLAPAMPSPM